MTGSGRMPLVELVAFRIDNIREEFDTVLKSFHQWTAQAISFARMEADFMDFDSGAASGRDTQVTESSLLGMAAGLLLHNAAAFDRRVVRLFSRYLGDFYGQ